MHNIRKVFEQRASEVANKRGTTRYIILYKDGHVSRDKKTRGYEDFRFEIPIPQFYYNLKSRLLFCYDNGKVNVMTPQQLFEKKLSREGIKQDGYNIQTGVNLVNVFVCREDDFLVIYSTDGMGNQYVRADAIEFRKPHKTMHTPGNQFTDGTRPYRWLILPNTMRWLVAPILKRGNHSGCLLKDYKYSTQLEYIHTLQDELEPPAVIKCTPL